MQSQIYTGTLISFFSGRNYGFITADKPIPGVKAEIFIHGSDVADGTPLPLIKNTRVQFQLAEFNGKMKAVKVTVLS
jgi:cold shock CspA family protein